MTDKQTEFIVLQYNIFRFFLETHFSAFLSKKFNLIPPERNPAYYNSKFYIFEGSFQSLIQTYDRNRPLTSIHNILWARPYRTATRHDFLQ